MGTLYFERRKFLLVYFASNGPELGLSKLSASVFQHLMSLRQLCEGGATHVSAQSHPSDAGEDRSGQETHTVILYL